MDETGETDEEDETSYEPDGHDESLRVTRY